MHQTPGSEAGARITHRGAVERQTSDY